MLRSGKKEMFGSSVQRRHGRNDGRHHRARLYRPVAKDVSRPRQASLGPRRFASIRDFGVPIVGPGVTVGTVETRVPRAGLPGPTTSSGNFAKDQALQAWRASPGLFPSARGLPSRGHFGCHQGSSQRLGEASSLAGFLPHQAKRLGEDRAKGSARHPASWGFLPREASSVSVIERTWALRPPQSHGRGHAR